MRKLIVLLMLLMLMFRMSQASTIQFGDSTVVSLITCEPGKAVYTKFGHTAIRIQDTLGIDLVYNYGVFDFKTPNFYLKFLRGHTDYMLAVYPTAYFLMDYEARKSNVWEQKLNLTKEEKDELIYLLNVNNQPENRMYRYNFVYDNCSTRPFYIIAQALKNNAAPQVFWKKHTARSMISDYLADSPWVNLGVNLVFGQEADQILRIQESIFLPEFLMDYYQHAELVDENNLLETTNLVDGDAIPLLKFPHNEKSALPLIFHPVWFFLLWLIAGAVLLLFKKSMDDIANCIFDFLLFFIIGIGGLIVFFLMFYSEHPLVGENLSLLWLSPLNIIVAFLVCVKKTAKILFYYFIIYALTVVSYIVIAAANAYVFLICIAPLLALILLRIAVREHQLFKKLYM